MKIAIMYDDVSESMSGTVFESMIKMYKDVDSDIKILCRGIEGRTGDKYDILRGRDDVIFSAGMPVLLHALVEHDWVPDVTMALPERFEVSLVL